MIRALRTAYVISSLVAGLVIVWVSIQVTLRQQGGPVKKDEVAIENSVEEKSEDIVIEEPVKEEVKSDIKVASSVYVEKKDTTTTRDRSVEEVRGEIEAIFPEGEARNWALSVGRCESGFNDRAVSPSGKYIGVFQYDRSTFASNCTGDIWDASQQISCTKKLFDKGERWRWPACNQKYESSKLTQAG